jgi:hypothetical protein
MSTVLVTIHNKEIINGSHTSVDRILVNFIPRYLYYKAGIGYSCEEIYLLWLSLQLDSTIKCSSVYSIVQADINYF